MPWRSIPDLCRILRFHPVVPPESGFLGYPHTVFVWHRRRPPQTWGFFLRRRRCSPGNCGSHHRKNRNVRYPQRWQPVPDTGRNCAIGTGYPVGHRQTPGNRYPLN